MTTAITVTVRFADNTSTVYSMNTAHDCADLCRTIENDTTSPYTGTNFAVRPVRLRYGGDLVEDDALLVPGGTYRAFVDLVPRGNGGGRSLLAIE
jgi:hypothetical protein